LQTGNDGAHCSAQEGKGGYEQSFVVHLNAKKLVQLILMGFEKTFPVFDQHIAVHAWCSRCLSRESLITLSEYIPELKGVRKLKNSTDLIWS
jgi:hypothetical protein